MARELNPAELPVVAIMLSLATAVFTAPWLHDDDVKDGNLEPTRRGEVIASTIVISSGLFLSTTTKSKLPLFIAVVFSAIYCTGIEYVARKNACQEA